MTAINQNFSTWTGNDEIIGVTTYTPQGTIQSIVGATAIVWVLKKRASDLVALVTKTLGSGIAITDGDGGKFEITLPGSATATLASGEYYHEAKVTLASGESDSVITGTIHVNKSGIP